MIFNLSQNRLLKNMRQIEIIRQARPTSMVCEIDFLIRRGGGPLSLVKKCFSRQMLRIGICAMYLSLLSVLLLSPHPAAVFGLKSIPSVPGGDATMHLGSFALLTLLIHSMRWPKPIHWSLVVLLLGYAAATESLQALVPPRTVELKDFIANVFGIAAGSVVYWSLQRTFQVLCGIAVNILKKFSLKAAFHATPESCPDLCS